MLTLYDYSDLADVSPETRNSWLGEIAVRQKYYQYYTGLIFEEKVPLEEPAGEEPLLYPVGINLAKMLCLAQTDSLFGEWQEDIVSFEPRQDGKVTDNEKRAADLAKQILATSKANVMLWEVGHDGNVYGGGVIKVSPMLKMPGHIQWSRTPLDTFFPIWDPEDEDNLLELYIVTPLTPEQARIKYGVQARGDNKIQGEYVLRVEHWTQRQYTTKVAGQTVNKYSGVNPFGFIPYVFIPRMRSTHWWGDSLVEDVIKPQNELNMRIADLGEVINFNAHPIKYGYNLKNSFNAKNYPVGPGIFWDLGKSIGQSPEPKVGLLEAQNPIPQGTFDYINFLYDWTRTSTFAPPIAFGEDNGGGQRSGITLEIRLIPLIRAVRRQRAYMAEGLSRALKMSAMMLKQKDLDDVPKRALDVLIERKLTPVFAPIMPRDQAAIVDEVVKRMATTPPSISLETAVKKLGDGTAEVDRITEMLKKEELWARSQPMLDPAGMNSGTGNAPNKKEPSDANR